MNSVHRICSGCSASVISTGGSDMFAMRFALPSSPSDHARPPHAEQMNSTKMNGFRSGSYPPIEMPVLPPSEAAIDRCGSILASAPKHVSIIRNPVNPRAADAAGNTPLAIVPGGAITSSAR